MRALLIWGTLILVSNAVYAQSTQRLWVAARDGDVLCYALGTEIHCFDVKKNISIPGPTGFKSVENLVIWDGSYATISQLCAVDSGAVRCGWVGRPVDEEYPGATAVGMGRRLDRCFLYGDSGKVTCKVSFGSATTPLETGLNGATKIAVSEMIDEVCVATANQLGCWGYSEPLKMWLSTYRIIAVSHLRQLISSGGYFCFIDDTGLNCPRAVDPPSEFKNADSITANYNSFCALKGTTMGCWDWNGQSLAIPATAQVSHPEGIFLMGQHVCVVDDQGPHCWSPR